MADTSGYLRNRPRQKRSAARVEMLLDTAEKVFEEVGYESATTNQVAARAEVPVGTLYRWFPDKAALAQALAERYLEDLVALYDQLLVNDPTEAVKPFIRRVVAGLDDFAAAHRALPALLVSATLPGDTDSPGARLRQGLLDHVRGLVELRVPGLEADARDRTADVLVTVAYAMVARASLLEGDERRAMFDNLADVLLSYLNAKFPPADSPIWHEPDPEVRPLRAAPQVTATG